jgi:flagellar biosynthetic protein FlhB
MSEAADKESKTQQATEKKLVDAREQGNAPISREASNLAYLLAGIAVLGVLAESACSRLAEILANVLQNAGSIRILNEADAALELQSLGLEAAAPVVTVVAAFAVAGVAASVTQNAPRFVLKRIAPDFSRISPAGGLKRMFGASGLLEFFKALVRLTAILCSIAVLARFIRVEFQNSMFLDPGNILPLTRSCMLAIFYALALMSFTMVALDMPLAHGLWRKSLRMTQQEVKDEHKQAEGDPHIKGRRRAIARSRARKRLMAAVPKATVVIANPTHYAIALRYVREEGGAPKVVAKGQDYVALAIRRIAEERRIPVIDDKVLARALYKKVEVEQMIPVEFYRAVAEILIRLQSRRKLLK